MQQILWTALVTPFEAHHGSIDYESLARLVRIQEQAHNGIVLLGSTGESLSLSNEERRLMLEFVLGLKPQVPIIVGVPNYNLEAAREWMSFCNELALDGYLLTTPVYTKPGILGQSAWFENLLDHARHKAMLYNIPGRSGIRLFPEVLKNLRTHERLWALKESSGSSDAVVEYRMAAPHLKIYCGDDYLLPAAHAEGASGLVSVMSNAWAHSTRAYVDAVLTHKKITTSLFWQAGKAVSLTSNPVPIKALLKDIGLISSDYVRLPLCNADLPSRSILLDLHSALNNWTVIDD